ncbi:MAG TPA: 30S ribosomal protein S17 [Dissulfuribacter thermophilus]|uniref:Small ribosomal subunit protein uS17 n=1 Tax=Dissulfuribacter thermophilus TaxID=1156395 RepID=A0A7V2WT75_9BACT|nr:30S ribosomal protein S17 [Dissulfuribacter thermophilus]
MDEKKGLKRVLVGRVTSDKMDKTVVVTVVRRFRHPIYGKFVQRRKKYMAHDPANQCRNGDKVTIEESRPFSKHKRWMVQRIVERAV